MYPFVIVHVSDPHKITLHVEE